MNAKPGFQMRSYAVLYIYGIALLLILFFLTGCGILGPCPVDDPALRMVEDWRAAREDNELDQTEIRMIDRDAGFIETALEEKSQPFQLPTTGIPWIDAGAALATVAASVFATNKLRDRKRRVRGEPVEAKRA